MNIKKREVVKFNFSKEELFIFLSIKPIWKDMPDTLYFTAISTILLTVLGTEAKFILVFAFIYFFISVILFLELITERKKIKERVELYLYNYLPSYKDEYKNLLIEAINDEEVKCLKDERMEMFMIKEVFEKKLEKLNNNTDNLYYTIK